MPQEYIMMDEVQQQDTDPSASLQATIELKNIVDKLDEEDLSELSRQCKKGFDLDLESRSDWEKETEDWLDIASQLREAKSFPWPDASNIKYPLILTAAMQFNARAYPSLVPNDGNVVKAEVFGTDPTGEVTARASRVEKSMSYQVMHKLPGWEEDMDQALMILPITGMVFKKTYFDSFLGMACSKLVLVQNLVVNYWAKSLEDAERVSEILTMSAREVKERQRAGIYADVDLGEPDKSLDADGIYELIEQHTFADLDKDDYKEPYTILFEKKSGKILRITARFDSESIKINEKKKIVHITPLIYYTKFGFIKAVDGSFYDKGFGHLLGPLNEAVNTNVNQLTDAGTLNNMSSGFLGKGIKLKQGNNVFSPGEWKVISTTAEDLRKQILPLPTKEPSEVLFKLLEMLINAGKELASVAEIFVGKMPGQNTPATTTMASIEQGMKLFTAIYKRVYRSLAEEFKKLYRINYLYFDSLRDSFITQEIQQQDFNTSDYRICPAADPSVSSQTERLLKAQGLLELLPAFGAAGLIDPAEVLKRVLEAQEQPNWQRLIPGMAQTGQPQPQQQPDPAMMEMQMKQEAEQAKSQLKAQELERKGQLEVASKQAELAMRQQEHQQELQHRQAMNQLDASAAEHKQAIFERQAEAKLSAAKEQASLQSQKSNLHGKSGKPTNSRK